jgi:PhnB protein
MKGKVNPIPEGYRTATPYLIVKGAAEAIEFYKRAFNAEELFRFDDKGKIGHAEIRIGDSRLMLADEYPDMNARSPQAFGGSPVSIMLYVDDVDTFVDRAVKAGAEITQPIEDKFYGDRSGSLTDPFGHVWHIATHVEDVPPEELHKRSEAYSAST